jgi:hypothetical protein
MEERELDSLLSVLGFEVGGGMDILERSAEAMVGSAKGPFLRSWFL